MVSRALTTPALLLLVALPVLKAALHLAVGRGYGYHGDELYYLACADHLDWAYRRLPPEERANTTILTPTHQFAAASAGIAGRRA